MNEKSAITIYGRLGKNPELRQTKNNKPFCIFSLAEQVEGQDKPRWHNVVMWEKDSEHWAKVLMKGSSVMVRGQMNERVYNNRQYLEINAEAIGLSNS